MARIHPAWWVALVAVIALMAAAGFRSAPSVLMLPVEEEFGWSRTVISFSITINLLLFGLTAPFAAALMARFGMRKVTSLALALIGAGAALSTFVTSPWMLVLTWGVLIGLGTGSIALVFAATLTDNWFVKRRGLVVGVLTAASATGQLIFLPIVASLAQTDGWRTATLVVAAVALAMVPLVALLVRNSPVELNTTPYGAPDDWTPPAKVTGNPARNAIETLKIASRSRTFWALAIGFAICGATTNGLVGTHFIPSAHDHGMGTTVAAGLLAMVGVFDVLGTIASGWLTDRYNPRLLLGIYYVGRGLGLLALPFLLAPEVRPPMILFIVIYGLDWVATVPPTVALCREHFPGRGPLVFGWVFAAHQVGAAAAALGAGAIRDSFGSYSIAWFGAAGLCLVAALLSIGIRRATPAITNAAPAEAGAASEEVRVISD